MDNCPYSLDLDAKNLCQIISVAPVLIDLPEWLQWNDFFQPKYGDLKLFIENNRDMLPNLILFETSKSEIFRLPSNPRSESFQNHLSSNNIRLAVAELCSIIIQEGSIAYFSFNVYRTFIETWLRTLRSSAVLSNNLNHWLSYILQFFVYLPTLIGQSRLVKEMLLEPFDQIFQNEFDTNINPRLLLWNQATRTQRMKLELWGYKLEINEWKNTNKWSGQIDETDDEVSIIEVKQDFKPSAPRGSGKTSQTKK